MCCLIDKHGFDILRMTKNRYYPVYVKQNVIDRVLVNNESIWSVSLDIGLHGDGLFETIEEEIERLRKENLYLKAELEC